MRVEATRRPADWRESGRVLQLEKLTCVVWACARDMGMVRLTKSGDDAEVTQTASNKVSTAAESGPEVITSALHSQKTIRADSTFQSI